MCWIDRFFNGYISMGPWPGRVKTPPGQRGGPLHSAITILSQSTVYCSAVSCLVWCTQDLRVFLCSVFTSLKVCCLRPCKVFSRGRPFEIRFQLTFCYFSFLPFSSPELFFLLFLDTFLSSQFAVCPCNSLEYSLAILQLKIISGITKQATLFLFFV